MGAVYSEEFGPWNYNKNTFKDRNALGLDTAFHFSISKV